MQKSFDDMLEEDILSEEGAETEEELGVDYLNSLADVLTWSTDWTIETIVNQIEKNNIDMEPSFQRRDAWSPIKKSRLIESIVYGLPIPQLVLAEDKNRKGRFIIVDGKQRLLTLFQFCSSKVDIDQQVVLHGLKNPKLQNLTYENFKEKQPNLFNAFLNQSIRSVIIKNWSSETLLYTIFYRLNTGSLPLSPQELRQALHPGPFINFVDDISQENKEIKQILKLEKPDYRMRDMDLVIRFFSYKNRIKDYNGNYKNFLDETCKSFNKKWAEMEPKIKQNAEEMSLAINFCIEIFGAGVFRKWSKGKFDGRLNRAVFDIMTYYFSDRIVIKKFNTAKRKSLVKDKFIDLCKNNRDFLKSISSNTNNLLETSTRFSLWGKSLNSLVPRSVVIPIKKQK